MVKVLENSIVDLDILPGHQQIEIQRQLREQLNNASKQAQGAVDGAAGQGQGVGGRAQEGVQIPKELLPDTMSDEQKSQARSVAGTILDGSGNVIGGLAGTVGGVLKGVGDTAGNTVFALGSGLAQTGVGAATGLFDTAKAPFAGGNTSSSQVATGEEAAVKKGPRKIEIRNGKAVEVGREGQESFAEAVKE